VTERPAPEERRPTPVVVEYFDVTHKPAYPRPRPRGLPDSTKAFVFLCLVSAIGLSLRYANIGKVSLGVIAVPFLWFGAAWYVCVRIEESRSPEVLKAFKAFAGMLATLLAPFILCNPPTDNSIASYFLRYGWHGRQTGDLGRFLLASLGGLLLLFTIADVADWIVRWRRRRRRDDGPTPR
jgi:hypothetical protein